MSKTISFTVPTLPVAQPRPRAFARGGHARVYGAPKEHPVHSFKALVRLMAMQEHAGPLLAGPLRVSMVFVMPRPKALTWKKRAMPRRWHTGRPDLDNLSKAVLDSLLGVTYADDAQVAEVKASKQYAAGGEGPHVNVTLAELEDEETVN